MTEKSVIFLFETTGYASKPFKDRGWHTTIIDIQNTNSNPNADLTLNWDILKHEDDIVKMAKKSHCKLVFGFPPCTDLAVSGAAHFSLKKLDNPNFQNEAVYLARSVERIGDKANTDWALENPISVLSTMWRAPDFMFHPYEYGGYLSEDDTHPDYPEYIKPRDAYEKKTYIWCDTNFIRPPKKPVDLDYYTYSTQHHKLGGKSEKTKKIRSASPRGFFTGLAEVYDENF